LVEGRGRKVEVSHLATFTAVCDGDGDALALVSSPDFPAAYRILIRVAARVLGEIVKEEVGHGTNEICVLVDDPTCTKTSVIESALASLSTFHETGKVAARWRRGRWRWRRVVGRRSGLLLGLGRRLGRRLRWRGGSFFRGGSGGVRFGVFDVRSGCSIGDRGGGRR
jgi:hypothetical protein